jgi:hypothetical protein
MSVRLNLERAWSWRNSMKNTGEIWYFKIVSEGAVAAAGFDVSKRLPVIPSKGFLLRRKMH